MTARAVCIEVGGGGIQTVVFDGGAEPAFLDGASRSDGAPLLIAVPGLVAGGRVVAASNLRWFDVDPVAALGLDGTARVVANDAQAAALGEAVLRGVGDLAYLGLGTGIGGAIVRDGAVVEHEVFGHRGSFGEAACPCGRTGCLETVAAGWALPSPVPAEAIGTIAAALARSIEDAETPELIVIGGGLARRYPAILRAVRALLGAYRVEASAAPGPAKSAAAWGLLRLGGIEVDLSPSRPARSR